MLLGELELDSAPAMSALSKVDTKFSGSMSAMATLSDGAGAAFASLAAAVAALAGTFEGLKTVTELGSQFHDMSLRTGETVGSLTILQEAFKEAGLGADGVEPFFLKLENAMGGVNEEGGKTDAAFEALGVSVNQLKGLDAIGQMEALQKGFAGIADQSDRVQVARNLFGKSGAQTLSLIGEPKALDEARQRAGPLADLMERNAGAFHVLGDAAGALKLDFAELFGGALSQIAPTITSMLNKIGSIDFTGIGEGVGALANVFLTLGDAVLSIAPAINFVSEGLSSLLGSGSTAAAGLSSKYGGLGKLGSFDEFGSEKSPVSSLQKVGGGGGFANGGDPILSESRRQTSLLQRIADAVSKGESVSSVAVPV